MSAWIAVVPNLNLPRLQERGEILEFKYSDEGDWVLVEDVIMWILQHPDRVRFSRKI